MLRHRIQSGLIIGGALVAAAFWLPMSLALVVMLIVGALGLWEFHALLDAAKIPNFKILGVVLGSAVIAANFLALRGTIPFVEVEWIVLFGAVAAICLRQFSQKNNPKPIETIACTILGIIYVPFFFSFFSRLLLTWGEASGRLLVLYLVVVVKFSDIGAFFTGCRFGRHKLIPRISPAKTWEGLIGGIAVGSAASVIFYLVSRGTMGSLTMSLADAILLGVVLSVAGAAGDLTESLFKRSAGVKDSSRMIQGMGGVLDVIDSLLFTAPALYAYARLFLTNAS